MPACVCVGGELKGEGKHALKKQKENLLQPRLGTRSVYTQLRAEQGALNAATHQPAVLTGGPPFHSSLSRT